jgi:hypothetical protein
MGFKEEWEKAYHKGRTEAKGEKKYGNLGTDLMGTYNNPPENPALRKAYYEGKKDERESSSNKGGGGCFITTACVEARGLSDNCPELNTLRAFRDKYIRALPNGEQLISEYYAIAPRVIAGIKHAENSKEVYLSLYERLVLKSLRLIRSGKKDEAFKNYLNIVNELKQKYQ